jgi:ABC-type proline/glycine betaine transport system substrate-binding protein
MVSYLAKRDFSIDEINAQLIDMEAQQSTAEEAVEDFFRNNEEIWTDWFTAEEVATIKAAL